MTGSSLCQNRNRSSTFSQQLHETGEHVGDPKVFEVDYGSGSVLGFEGKDTVTMAGLEMSDVFFGLVLYEDQQVIEINGSDPSNVNWMLSYMRTCFAKIHISSPQ